MSQKNKLDRPCIVAMQPSFLPWAGYFNLLTQADDFVFLDDAQLENRSWHTRNRWAFGAESHWIAVPVCRQHRSQTIQETQLANDQGWRPKLERSFVMNYGRHPFFNDAAEIVELLLSATHTHLADLNESIISLVVQRFSLNVRLHRASSLGIAGKRSERLTALCNHFNAGTYLSPAGSADYLAEDGFSEKSEAKLEIQSFSPQAYPQKGAKGFISHLSILDVVANIGWTEAANYSRTGGFCDTSPRNSITSSQAL